MDQSVINFKIYEDGTEYYGMANVQMPTLSNMTQTLTGAGVSGEIEEVVLGHQSAMTVTLNFRTTTPAAIRLSEPRRHVLDFRIANEDEDQLENELTVPREKHVMTVIPKTHNVGQIAIGQPTNASGEYAVRYWATWLDGVKVREIDPMNMKYEVNGVDYLADVRAAIGMS